jgi:hypothetical protein
MTAVFERWAHIALLNKNNSRCWTDYLIVDGYSEGLGIGSGRFQSSQAP